jgi:hypothetical protein
MSMRLDFDEREVLWSALYSFIENVSGEEEYAKQEQIARRLQKRLDDFAKRSFANRKGGSASASRREGKIRVLQGIIEGATGQKVDYWTKPAPDS